MSGGQAPSLRRALSPPTLLLIASALLITSCSVGPTYKAPAVPAPPAYKEANPDTYKETGEWKPAQPSDAKIRGDWWTLFNDPQLDALEQQIDVSNQNLKVAQARFTQARAMIRFNRSGLFPTLSIGPEISANRGSATATLSSPASQANYGNFVL